MSAHALWQYTTGDLSRVGFVSSTGAVEYRVSSFFPHPNQLAGFVVLFVPLSVGLYSVFESKIARAGCVLLPLLALPAAILTYSRGVLVALVALVLVLARSKRAWPAIAAAAALVVLLAPAAWHDRVADVGRLDRPEIATRLDFWDAALAMFQQNPVLGVGLNSFDVAYVDLEQTGRSFLPGSGLAPPETAHNLYLNTLAEQGLVGIAALFLLILAAGRMILALRRSADPRIRGFGLGHAGRGDRAARLEPLRRDLRRPEDLHARLDDPGRRRGAPADRPARGDPGGVRGDLLFYSDFPFGFHNTEAEEKMSRFAARGWRVSYVEQLGIRNPRPRHALRALKRAKGPEREAPFEVVSPKLLPPRRAPGVGRVNRRWLARQLRKHVRDPAEAVLWIRFPTPEIIPLAVRSPWRAVVYEAVDDHAAGPGMTDRLRELFAQAEERLLARTDVVFAWSEPIRAALAVRHPNVHLATAAVDLDELEPVACVAGQERTAVFTGEMGFRFDEQLAAAVAGKLPDWTFLLAGPASPEAEEALAAHRNVVLTGRYDHHELPRLLARGRVALVPYRQNEFTDTLVPGEAGGVPRRRQAGCLDADARRRGLRRRGDVRERPRGLLRGRPLRGRRHRGGATAARRARPLVLLGAEDRRDGGRDRGRRAWLTWPSSSRCSTRRRAFRRSSPTSPPRSRRWGRSSSSTRARPTGRRRSCAPSRSGWPRCGSWRRRAPRPAAGATWGSGPPAPSASSRSTPAAALVPGSSRRWPRPRTTSALQSA